MGALPRPGGRWFAALPAAVQEAMMKAAQRRRFAADARIFERGDRPSGLYHLLSGRVRVGPANTIEGRETLLTFLEPPAWFGEVSCFDLKPRAHDVYADTDSEVLLINQESLEDILNRYPVAWRHLALIMAHHLRLMFSAFEEIGVLPLKVRLARRLLLMAKGLGEHQGMLLEELEITQQQLASLLFSSRSTVNAALKELESELALNVSRERIRIADIRRLTHAASIGSQD